MVEVGKDHLMVIEPMAPRLIMNDKGHLLRLGIAHLKQEEREQVEEGPSLKVCIITARECTQGHFQVKLDQIHSAYLMNHIIKFLIVSYASIDMYYSFLGTLNPALQDRNGQPKRDITTIIHILNDLLCAQYKNYSPGAPTENATATPSTNQTSAPHQTTSTNQSSKTSRSSESQKPVNITKSTKPGSNSCGSSNDKLEGVHQSLLQKPTLTAARETQSRLTEKIGNNFN